MINSRRLSSCSFLVMSLAFSLVSVSCGGSDDDDDKAPVVKYGDLKTSLLASTDVQSAILTTAACTRDNSSLLFSGAFTGPGGEKLDIKIRNFSTSIIRPYTCTQTADNVDGDLGEGYGECGIEFTIPNGNLAPSTYSTYRTAVSQYPFTYSGTCTVTPTYTTPKVTLTITCSNLIQTKLNGNPRNPISEADTASLASGTTVECSI
ncbi:MAG: hypothetical protein V4655_06535 [Bdellovibrionota bacterium]